LLRPRLPGIGTIDDLPRRHLVLQHEEPAGCLLDSAAIARMAATLS
jgi:hypothetical protein